MNIRQKIAQFAAYQRTVRELNALTGRQLNDLGIQLIYGLAMFLE